MCSIKKRISKKLSPYNKIIVWGAGGLGKMALSQWLPSQHIIGIVDSAPERIGTLLQGKHVYSPQDILSHQPDLIVVCSQAYTEINKQINALGYQGKVIYFYELFLPESNEKLSHLEMLKIDIMATKNNNWLVFLFNKPQILVNITYRLTHWFKENKILFPFYYLFWVLHSLTCIIFSIQLPANTPIGPGLVFAHYGTIVFTARARIGAFFTIYHGCTVGTDDTGQGPTIGNFVYQYAGSHVLGKCNIGDYNRIGANAVAIAIKSPDNATIVGIPAKVKK